jgi:hypothetical protein
MAEGIYSGVALKNLSYIGGFFFAVEFLGFNPQSIVILALLMLTDIVTGVTRVWINEGGREIRSSALKKGLTAKALLSSGVFAIALTSKGVGFDFQSIASGGIMVLMLGECYSILGNIHSARTGEPKVEFDALAVIIKRIKRLLDKIVKII